MGWAASKSLSPRVHWATSKCQKETLKFSLWLCQNSYWTWWFIVDLPIENGGSFHSYVYLYQRVEACEGPWEWWKPQNSTSHATLTLCHPALTPRVVQTQLGNFETFAVFDIHESPAEQYWGVQIGFGKYGEIIGTCRKIIGRSPRKSINGGF